jgi:hypothetical protein
MCRVRVRVRVHNRGRIPAESLNPFSASSPTQVAILLPALRRWLPTTPAPGQPPSPRAIGKRFCSHHHRHRSFTTEPEVADDQDRAFPLLPFALTVSIHYTSLGVGGNIAFSRNVGSKRLEIVNPISLRDKSPGCLSLASVNLFKLT